MTYAYVTPLAAIVTMLSPIARGIDVPHTASDDAQSTVSTDAAPTNVGATVTATTVRGYVTDVMPAADDRMVVYATTAAAASAYALMVMPPYDAAGGASGLLIA